MARRDIGTDDPRVRVRPGKGTRPRTKVRPDYSTRPLGRIIAVDRGRYTVVLDDDATQVHAVRAKELPRGSVIMGDHVRLSGDISGRTDTLARIVAVEDRVSVLRRSLEDAADHKGEKAIIANAELMVIVVALADPPPRTGMIDRCLVACFEAGMRPVLCLTKADLASPDTLLAHYQDFDLDVVVTQVDSGLGLDELRGVLTGRRCVFVGHSGVGKSTLINALVPNAHRATGHVNDVTGRGRHTSTSSAAFELPGGGWVVDTPGVRSFGLGHVSADDVLAVFPDVAQATQWCLPLCTHAGGESQCAIDVWVAGAKPFDVVDPLDVTESLSAVFDGEGAGHEGTGTHEEAGAASPDPESVDSRQSILDKRASHAASVRRLLEAVATAEAVSKAAR